MTRLYLVRHGETEWNKASKVQGRTDIELSCEGIKQAQLLAERLARENIDYIYSSSLKRALKTAEIIADYKSCGIVKSEEYHEICLGPWEGMTINEIREKYSEHFRVYKEDPANFKLPGAETFMNLTERTYNAIIEIVRKHKGSNILLVSHGTAIKAAIIRILGIDIVNYTKFRIDNVSISIIDFPEDMPEKPVVLCLNDTSHLKEA
ncbi:MAG TPA: histidine phosphatase family protein [Clostridia bacterium]|nr:histidine phosphatase family protein [Clostridia bacterium]